MAGRNDRDLSEFAKWLTKRMGVLSLKNADVARATNVTGPAVSLWRTGVNVPDNDRIEDLADILQVTPETILIKLGRMKPREGITKEWEDIITRFQDAGPEAERLLFAIGDALLLALNQNRTQTEIVLSLDPIFRPDSLETMRGLSDLEEDEALLLYDRVRLPNNNHVRMLITAFPSDNANRYIIVAEANDEDMPEVIGKLKVGSAMYQTTSHGPHLTFEDVILDETIGTITLTLER